MQLFQFDTAVMAEDAGGATGGWAGGWADVKVVDIAGGKLAKWSPHERRMTPLVSPDKALGKCQPELGLEFRLKLQEFPHVV